jgi:hypothetical protein
LTLYNIGCFKISVVLKKTLGIFWVGRGAGCGFRIAGCRVRFARHGVRVAGLLILVLARRFLGGFGLRIEDLHVIRLKAAGLTIGD